MFDFGINYVDKIGTYSLKLGLIVALKKKKLRCVCLCGLDYFVRLEYTWDA